MMHGLTKFKVLCSVVTLSETAQQHNTVWQIVFGKFCNMFFIGLSKRYASTDNCTFRIKEPVLNFTVSCVLCPDSAAEFCFVRRT
jgi:hypothetical protein